MAELFASAPFAALLPLSVGSVELAAVDLGRLTLITPYKDREAALSKALQSAHDVALPAPNRTTGQAGCRVLWFALGQVMLAGPEPDPGLAEHAALVDQSDGWVTATLQGEGAEDVLARLVPVDLRAAIFKRGYTVRTQLQHMSVSITRTGAERFQIMVFRSMAKSFVHDLETAMEGVAARG